MRATDFTYHLVADVSGKPRHAQGTASRPPEPILVDMKKPTAEVADADEMLAEYDFSGGVRGKYAKLFAASEVTVRVEAPEIKKRESASGKKRKRS